MVHLMTYDFHGAWEKETHHNAPLCGYPANTDKIDYFTVVSDRLRDLNPIWPARTNITPLNYVFL